MSGLIFPLFYFPEWNPAVLDEHSPIFNLTFNFRKGINKIIFVIFESPFFCQNRRAFRKQNSEESEGGERGKFPLEKLKKLYCYQIFGHRNKKEKFSKFLSQNGALKSGSTPEQK